MTASTRLLLAAGLVISLCSASLDARAFTTESFYSDAIIVATDERRAGPVDLSRDVATAIAACWHAPRDGDEITFRTSFKRDGSIFGKPRITFMRAASGPDGTADLANSLLEAIKACVPLPFTPRLGAAIAGRVFLIRLVAPRKERRVRLEPSEMRQRSSQLRSKPQLGNIDATSIIHDVDH